MKNLLINGAEISDVKRGNRGAEHLLRTTVKHVGTMGYAPTVAAGKVDSSLARNLGLKRYLGNPRFQVFDPITPPIDYRGFTTINALHGVLDASGFALGDAWGVHTAKWLDRKYGQWKSRGLRTILLPQAFGPFTEPDLRVAALSALSQCDAVFARDEVSYGHLMELGVSPELCGVSPDITIGERTADDSSVSREPRFVLVPNWNLAERGGGTDYLDTLVDSVNWAKGINLDVVGLLHEGNRDLEILRQVNARSSIKIIDDLSGWQTKQYISKSTVVLAGRYHAVLAALMTSTPVVTHSWSHKYRAVLEQFGVPEWLCSPTNSHSTIGGLEAAVANGIPFSLQSNRARLSAEVDEMWQRIETVLL